MNDGVSSGSFLGSDVLYYDLVSTHRQNSTVEVKFQMFIHSNINIEAVYS